MMYVGDDAISVLNMEIRGSFIAWFLGHVREGHKAQSRTWHCSLLCDVYGGIQVMKLNCQTTRAWAKFVDDDVTGDVINDT